MAIERQTIWKKLVVIDMFLGGAGAGLYIISFILVLLGGDLELARTGMLIGPILMAAGLLFLLLELGMPKNIFRVFTGLSTSWMSRGALIQTLFILAGLIYALPAFWQSLWLTTGAGIIIGSIGFLLALISAIYHGLFLSKAKGVALWSLPVMPVLSMAIAVSSGIGFLLLIFSANPQTATVMAIQVVIFTGIIMVIAQITMIWALLSLNAGITYSKSIKSGSANLTISLILLIVSLILLISGLWVGNIPGLSWGILAAGLLLIAGGFMIRQAIITSGHHYSLRVPLSR